MLNKTLLAITLAFVLPFAAAQNTPPPPPSPAKRDLVARILKAQQPAIEAMARGLVEQPAVALLDSAGNALANRVPKERQEAVAKEIQADVQKYMTDLAPVVQARAVKLAPTTVGAVLADRFTEDELKQVLAILESPVFGKYQRLGEEMQKSLAEKLIPEMRPTVGPRLRSLEETVGKRLSVTGGPKAAAPKPAKPASK